MLAAVMCTIMEADTQLLKSNDSARTRQQQQQYVQALNTLV